MDRNWVVMGIEIFLFAVMAAGILFFFQKDFQYLAARFRMRNRLRARRQALDGPGKLKRHILQLTAVTLGRAVPGEWFLGITVLLGGGIFIKSFGILPLWAGTSASLCAASLPYLFLRMRLDNIRKRGSREGEALVSELLRQYRVSGFNIYEAIERVVEQNKDLKLSRKRLFRLLLELRSTGDPKVIDMAVSDFTYGFNTNWSRMLGHNIRMAALKGLNVSSSIEDILIQLRDARKLMEERKRLNSEAARMTLYMVPLLYLAAVFMSVRYLDMPLGKLLQNQFNTSEGLLMFLLIAFLYIVNGAILGAVSNRRFDF